MTFRIKFAKYGFVKFIGHLDVMRYFQKVIRRSVLPVSYSQGFSPHQLMSFALPLGVGVTSDGEYMEVEFEDEPLRKLAAKMKCGEASAETENVTDGDPETAETETVTAEDLENVIFSELSRNTTEGFEILKVRKLPDPKPNVHQDKAMALVAAADYLIRVKDGYDIGFSSQKEFYDAFCRFAGQDSIEVTKKTKKSEKQINIKEFIYAYADTAEKLTAGSCKECSADEAGMECAADGTGHAEEYDNEMQFAIRLAAGSAMNIKPELVLEAFMENVGREYNENAFALHRMELLMGEAKDFRPLI